MSRFCSACSGVPLAWQLLHCARRGRPSDERKGGQRGDNTRALDSPSNNWALTLQWRSGASASEGCAAPVGACAGDLRFHSLAALPAVCSACTEGRKLGTRPFRVSQDLPACAWGPVCSLDATLAQRPSPAALMSEGGTAGFPGVRRCGVPSGAFAKPIGSLKSLLSADVIAACLHGAASRAQSSSPARRRAPRASSGSSRRQGMRRWSGALRGWAWGSGQAAAAPGGARW